MTMCLYCTITEIWRLKCWTHGRTHARTDAQVILYSVQCYALHWTDSKIFISATKIGPTQQSLTNVNTTSYCCSNAEETDLYENGVTTE